jgi:RNA 2',3'-cyclic 3'-phosphodiesterase
MQGVFDFYADLPATPRRPERLFFALFPDAETAARVSQVRERFIRDNHLRGTRLETKRLHVSLHHVGDYKRLRGKFIYAAQQAGKAVSMRGFEMTLRSIRSFERTPAVNDRLPRRPLVLLGEGADALPELHKMLGAAMEKNGLQAGARFTPHMTLLYGPEPVPAQAIDPIRFTVSEFALIHSELWLTRYNVIDRWSLAH